MFYGTAIGPPVQTYTSIILFLGYIAEFLSLLTSVFCSTKCEHLATFIYSAS